MLLQMVTLRPIHPLIVRRFEIDIYAIIIVEAIETRRYEESYVAKQNICTTIRQLGLIYN